MLPQTNLQLYRLLMARGHDEGSLAAVRAGYDAARQLFAGAFRPSHKPFISHLVGTAGALAGWGESIEVILAGLLHSVYLYGQFDDGERGAAPRRRQWLQSVIGRHAEELVQAYTVARWDLPFHHWRAAVSTDPAIRRLTAIKLADALDELGDGGLQFAPGKPFVFGESPTQQREVAELARVCVGPSAQAQFALAFQELSQPSPPRCLRTNDTSFHTTRGGVPELARSRLGRMLRRLQGSVHKRKAA